ncbi:hypothetical protein AB0H83_26255 [Dactylosporangium sp. NPDC050688]|uniref:hypothetical protein n=1 Tax=Dactylosporangium sp. NPDC050688 TaxID=3157217 RepID=UPI0033EF0021
MTRQAYIYVGNRAHGNFEIGMRDNIWGWKTFANCGDVVGQARSWLAEPDQDEPTWLIFVKDVTPAYHVSGWPRIGDEDFGAWKAATIGTVTKRLLTKPLYEDLSRTVWTNDHYPFRVDLDEEMDPADSFGPVNAAELSIDAIRAIRHSAMQRSWPVLGPPLFHDPAVSPERRVSSGTSPGREAVVRNIPLERHRTGTFLRRPGETVAAARREADLVSRYERYLEEHGHRAIRNEITLPGRLDTLFTDVYVEDTEELLEAKASAGRNHIRLAIGQLCDYARFVRPRSRAVLLPSRPEQDLVDLLRSMEIACVYERGEGRFARENP